VVGTYTVSKYIRWKYNEWEDGKVQEYANIAKKQYHFESNQRTCTVTFFSFLPDMRNTIAEHIDTESLLNVLKLKPANKVEVWEQLKVLSVSCVLCSVVSNVILLVILKVQLNVVGGYLFLQSSGSNHGDVSHEMSDVQANYMNNIRFFIEKQLLSLINDCVTVVQGNSFYKYLNSQLPKYSNLTAEVLREPFFLPIPTPTVFIYSILSLIILKFSFIISVL